MGSALDVLSSEDRRRLRKQRRPTWAAPMLATLTEEYFSDEAWVFERKLDGVRALAFCGGGRVRLLSRNRQTIGATYPELVEALERRSAGDAVFDGEIVAFRGSLTSFARLQGRMQIRDAAAARRSGIPVFLYLFDVMHIDGYDLSALPLRSRKAVLRRAVAFGEPLRYTAHRNADGEAFLAEACAKRWEGLIAKRADAPYVHARSRDWLKFKCMNRQEFVIGGYTEPHGSRQRFGALLIGYHDDGDLLYAGKVGTGFDRRTLDELGDRLARVERDAPPFADARRIRSTGVHWVSPELVGEFGFTEWTRDGRLRHPRYLGLRADKDPRDVVRERAT